MLQSMALQRAGHDLMIEQTKVNSGGAVVKNLSANVRDMGLSKLQELVIDREVWCAAQSMGHKELGMTEQLN